MAQCGGESSRRNEFPIGMRVLAVDDDRVCLRLLEAQLKGCGYQVTATQHAFTALKILRENKDNYDLVISDVQMPDMDGFKLLEIIGLEMDLPVIMLSVNSETGYVMKGVLHGAVDYLVKPVMLEDLKLIWKHVIKKSLLDKKGSNDPSNNYIQEKKADNDQYLRPARKCMDQIKEKEDYAHENSDGELSKQKRPRVSWSTDLHTRFIKAVDQLGFDRAVPKRILDLMNVQGLTRENVASHLQKYRKTLKENGIGLNQKAHDGSHLHGFSVDSPNSIILSFNHQAHSKVHPPEEYRLHEHKKNSMMVSPGPFQDSHRGALPSPFLPFSSLRSQAGHLRTEHVEFSSNSLGMERAYPCSGFNNFSHQFLTTTLDQIDDYTQNFSQKPWVSVGNPDSLSSSQVQCPSNQDSFETLFESNNSRFNDSAELNSVLPSDLDMASVSGDMLDMQRYGGETFKYTYHSESESTEHQPEDSPMETLFHLNKCHSADDLNTVLKQFQQ